MNYVVDMHWKYADITVGVGLVRVKSKGIPLRNMVPGPVKKHLKIPIHRENIFNNAGPVRC